MEGPSSLDDHRYDHHSRLLCTTSLPHEEQTALILLQIDSAYGCGLWATSFSLFISFTFSIFFQHIYTRILPNLLYLWYCQGNGIMHVMFSE